MPNHRSAAAGRRRAGELAACGLAAGLALGSIAGLALGAAPAAVGEAALASPCGGLPPPDLRRICERGELRVARYGGERPPFFFSADGGWAGFDVDLGRDIADRLGVRYAEDPTAESFDAVVERVAAGAADLGISKLSATLERALKVRFTEPYLTVYQALLVNRSAVPARGDPFALLGAGQGVVGALAGSAYVGYAEGLFGPARTRPYDDFPTMMGDVVAGRLDAALMDSARADAWRRGNPEQLIQVRTTIDRARKDPLAIAVGWQDTHLLAWLDLYLETIAADGTAEALYRRWFAEVGESAERGDDGGGR